MSCMAEPAQVAQTRMRTGLLVLVAAAVGCAPNYVNYDRPDLGDGADAPGDSNPGDSVTTSGDAGPGDGAGGSTGRWLGTTGNQILLPNGTPFLGRGVNLHDTRSCNACAWNAPSVEEVKRRVDLAVDGWGANFVRLLLESYGSAQGRVHWQGILEDPEYASDIVEIVDYIGTKPGVYVMVSLWTDPSFDDMGWPTAGTAAVWEGLAEVFADYDYVLFGLVNEPEMNYSGSLDAGVWQAMNDTVAAIRVVEARHGAERHVIAVQGTGGWSRFLGYYVDHPITAGGGANIAYEVHVYDGVATFADRFITPSQTIPVIIGEFGPANGYMTLGDCTQLMNDAEAAGVSYLAWTFHMRCAPDLLVDNSGGGCGVGMPLTPTAWGNALRTRLLTPAATEPPHQ